MWLTHPLGSIKQDSSAGQPQNSNTKSNRGFRSPPAASEEGCFIKAKVWGDREQQVKKGTKGTQRSTPVAQ